VGPKIARVRCNTCMGEHMYRGSQPSSSSTRPVPSRARASKDPDAPSKVVLGFDEQLATRDLGAARPYSVKTTYKQDDLIHHPTFGLGIVSAVRFDKVEVNFKMAQKTLIHGRGETPTEKPHFDHPRHAASGPADKPADPSAPPQSAPADEAGAGDSAEQ